MSLFSPLLIIGMGQEQVPAASALARDLGFDDAHIVGGGFAEAMRVVDTRASSPDFIIILLGSHGRDLLPALDEFALHCESKVRVAVVADAADPALAQELEQRGVLQYFVSPTSAEDIRRVLLAGTPHYHRESVDAAPGAVIACMSAASGDGASTLAVNLAYSLAVEHKQPTVLVDMDYQFGLICKSLDVAAPFGIRELFDHPERGLDELLVSKMLVSYKEKLSIIAAPSELRLLPDIHPEVVRDLIGVLSKKFRFVIIDVPHVWTDWTAATLTYADHVMMVAQLWLRSLTHATRLLAAWQMIGVKRDAVSLVINRSGAKFKEAVNRQDFEKICRRGVDATIANDVKAVTYAENHGHTLFEGNQDSAIRQQISDMALGLVTRYGDVEPAGTLAKRNLLAFPKRRKSSE